jgi:engulfment/cell motility protein 1
MNNHPSDELKLMILEYQAVFIQNISMRHGTAVSMHNPRHINMLNDIWNAAQVEQIDIPGAKKWKKLGFTVKLIKLYFINYH